MIEARLVASKGQHWVVTMLEKRTQQLTGFLVRGGLIIMISSMWEITTSVGIPLGLLMGCGATPLILKIESILAWFHSVPLWGLLTSLWTMIMTPTKARVTHEPYFKRKTFLPRLQSALLSWWRLGVNIQVQCSLFSLMTMENAGTGFRSVLWQPSRNSDSNLKIRQSFQTRAKSCSTHSSGPEFASPKTQTLP